MRLPNFTLSGIADRLVQQNFQRLIAYLSSEAPLQGFRLIEARLTAPGEQLIPHRLGFLPQDLFVTQLIGSATLNWNYSKFTAQSLSVTVGGDVSVANPTTLRALAGILNTGNS